MLNKRTIAKLAAITGLVAIIALVFTIKSADLADNAFRKHLKTYGIASSKVPPPEKRIGALRYKAIAFSEEGETSIDVLTITFSPLKWGSVKSIDIDGLFLSGELDINGRLSIKGLPPISGIFNLTNNLETLSISDLNFSILSAHIGGIRGNANIAANREETAFVWTGNIDTRQEQLELIAKFNGQINQNGKWFNDLEIENAKLERGFGKFTRVHGLANWNGDKQRWKELRAELNSGGFIANGTAWKNAAIAIQGSPAGLKSKIEAKSAGIEELELSIDSLYQDKKLSWSADIHSPTATQLINYFSTNNMMPVKTEGFGSLKDKKDINLRLFTKENSLIFNIKNQSQEIDIKGKIERKSINTIDLAYTSKEPLNISVKGNKCTKTKPSKLPVCRFQLTQDDTGYILKE